jgi:hypothetical protein
MAQRDVHAIDRAHMATHAVQQAAADGKVFDKARGLHQHGG